MEKFTNHFVWEIVRIKFFFIYLQNERIKKTRVLYHFVFLLSVNYLYCTLVTFLEYVYSSFDVVHPSREDEKWTSKSIFISFLFQNCYNSFFFNCNTHRNERLILIHATNARKRKISTSNIDLCYVNHMKNVTCICKLASNLKMLPSCVNEIDIICAWGLHVVINLVIITNVLIRVTFQICFNNSFLNLELDRLLLVSK